MRAARLVGWGVPLETAAVLEPSIARRVALFDAGRELAAFDAPAPPGSAAITDFMR